MNERICDHCGTEVLIPEEGDYITSVSLPSSYEGEVIFVGPHTECQLTRRVTITFPSESGTHYKRQSFLSKDVDEVMENHE